MTNRAPPAGLCPLWGRRQIAVLLARRGGSALHSQPINPQEPARLAGGTVVYHLPLGARRRPAAERSFPGPSPIPYSSP